MSKLRVVLAMTAIQCASGPLSGCSTAGEIKSVLQDVSATLAQIVTLTLAEPEGPASEQLYSAEDKILVACHELLETAHRSFEQEEIPLKTQVGAAFNTRRCEQVVEETQREVETIRTRSLSPRR